jgi:transcriptional regulator with XRE-family HTH domain
MGRRIPRSIRIEVLKQWLEGVSRDQIAKNNDIAFGTVSNILQEIKENDIPDIDLLRETASALKREDLELKQFARALRLKKFLDNLGMTEEQIENFLEHLNVFFYRNDVGDIKNFLMQLESVSDMVRNLDLSIYDIEEYIIDKQAELYSLILDIVQIKKNIEEEKAEFVRVVKNTERYRAARMFGG